MKKLMALGFTIVLASALGCGAEKVAPSAAAPPVTPEQTTQELEKAVESGQIDPATYGKQ